MKKLILFDAEPFCFGPISTMLNLIDYIAKETSLKEEYALVLLGTGTSKQLAEKNDFLDDIISCNTTSFEDLEKVSSLIQECSLFISTTNPHSINFLNQYSCKRFYIDTLFWLWGHLRADFSNVTTYYMQRFFNIDQQIKKFSTTIPHYKVVNPLIAYDLKKKEEKDYILINLGGIDNIYMKTSPFYDTFVRKISQSKIFQNKKTIIAGGGETIQRLKKNYQSQNLQIDCFSKEEFKQLFTSCKKFITTPGLTSIHESHFLKKDLFFLPPQNYSQYLHLQYLKKHLPLVNGKQYEELGKYSPIPEHLIEEEGIALVRKNIDKFLQEPSEWQKLFFAMETFILDSSFPFQVPACLDFDSSGVVEIGNDIVKLCHNSAIVR